MGADCKSAGVSLRWFKSIPAQSLQAGIAQLVELHPSKVAVVSSSLIARSLENNAHVAQSVEHILGKDEVHRFDPGRGLSTAYTTTMASVPSTVRG